MVLMKEHLCLLVVRDMDSMERRIEKIFEERMVSAADNFVKETFVKGCEF